MTKISMLRAIITVPLLAAASQAASAGILRTYVSALGSDSNPCTASSPCASFQAALARTTTGGEIVVLNSADYGPVTINKAVTITSEGAVAGVLATTGVAITIAAGASDVVNLRGLGLDGANSGGIGIQFISGKSLTVQKSFARNFTNSGIAFSPNASATLFVSDTVVTNNGSNGILVSGGSGAVNGALSHVSASGNGVGVLASGSGVNLAVTDTVTSNNTYGIGATASAVMVRNSTASNNSIGISSQTGATVRVSQSTITGNGTGWQATDTSLLQSYRNNSVGGNTTDGSATQTLALQ
jgi:hypothetical protein